MSLENVKQVDKVDRDNTNTNKLVICLRESWRGGNGTREYYTIEKRTFQSVGVQLEIGLGKVMHIEFDVKGRVTIHVKDHPFTGGWIDLHEHYIKQDLLLRELAK